MSIKWAKTVAAYLIKQCKEYSEYCGGDTNLVEVPDAGPALFIDDRSLIEPFEQPLTVIGEAMKIVLPDGRANDDTLEARLAAIALAIETARRSFTIKAMGVTSNIDAGTVTVSITGEPER